MNRHVKQTARCWTDLAIVPLAAVCLWISEAACAVAQIVPNVGNEIPIRQQAAMSLDQAIEKAFAQDPGLAAANLASQGQAVMVEAAQGGFWPTLTASSQVGFRHLETVSGRESLQTSRHALALRQSIYAGGGVQAALEAAKSRAKASDADIELVRRELKLAVVEAFLSVLRDQAILNLAISAEQELGKHTEAIRQRFRYGAVTAGDVAHAEAQLAFTTASRREGSGALNVSGAIFEEIVGEPPGELLVPNLPGDIPKSLQEALRQLSDHPLMTRAGFNVQAAEFDVGVASAALRPRVTLAGDLAMADQPEDVTSGRQDASIALNLTVPLYQGGIADAKQRAASIEADRQRQLMEQQKRSLKTAIKSAWERLQAGLEMNDSLSHRVGAAQISLDSYIEEVRVGDRSHLDLINAETDLLEAKAAAVNGRLTSIIDAYRLLSIIYEES